MLLSLGYILPNILQISFGDYVLYLAISLVAVTWSTYHIVYSTKGGVLVLMLFSALYYCLMLSNWAEYIGVFLNSGFLLLLGIAVSVGGTILVILASDLALKKIKINDKNNLTSVFRTTESRNQNIERLVKIIAKLMLIFLPFVAALVALLFLFISAV